MAGGCCERIGNGSESDDDAKICDWTTHQRIIRLAKC